MKESRSRPSAWSDQYASIEQEIELVPLRFLAGDAGALR